jgi:hypothetical protein
MALSDRLTDLASRTKNLEDTAATTQAKDRAKLDQQRNQLHSKMTTEAQNIQSSADKAQAGARSWWADTTARFEQQRNELRAKMDQQRAERKVDRAQHNADDAEANAADMISWAEYAIDSAEYAVIDAVIARDEANDLVAARR